jgi:uncharacterized protein (DUF58 family)
MPTRDAYVVALLALLIFFVAFNLQAGWVYAVDALLVAILVAGFLSTRYAVRGISVIRTLPTEATEGDPVHVGLTLRAAGIARRFFVEVHDAVPGLEPASVTVPAVTTRGATRISYGTQAVRRGVHAARTAMVQSGGLTGLFRVHREVAAPGTITIYPRYWKISRLPLAAWTPTPQTSGSGRRRGGLDFAGLRDYRAGDSVRHVHWRSSARRGALVVREFEQETPGAVVLLLDTQPDPYVGHRAADAFDDLIRAAASVAWYMTSHGAVVRILASRPEGALDVTVGWKGALDTLAGLQPDGKMAPRAVLAAAVLGRDAAVIALTGDGSMLTSLGGLGLLVAGILADVGSYEDLARDAQVSVASTVFPKGLPLCVLRKGDDIGARLEQGVP